MPEDKLSFIPKKGAPISVYKSRGPGLFLAFSFLLFIVSGLFLGGLVFYKKSLAKEVDLLKETLNKVRTAFEISLINEIVQTSDKINLAKTLLDKHKSITPFFDFLEASTLPEVRFKDFDYALISSGDKNEEIAIKMNGIAKNYTALAMQSEIFEKEKNIKSFYFSDFKLGEGGTVNFNVQIVLDQSFFKYKTQ